MRLGPLYKRNMEKVWRWRFENRPALRTPSIMAPEIQDRFYDEVICNRESPHRFFAIGEDGVLFGMGGLTYIQWENRTAELSLITAPEEKRKLEMFDLLLDEAFLNMNLHSVTGETYACGDLETTEALVRKYEGYRTTLPDRKFWAGEYWASRWFTITEDDHAACRNLDR